MLETLFAKKDCISLFQLPIIIIPSVCFNIGVQAQNSEIEYHST